MRYNADGDPAVHAHFGEPMPSADFENYCPKCRICFKDHEDWEHAAATARRRKEKGEA